MSRLSAHDRQLEPELGFFVGLLLGPCFFAGAHPLLAVCELGDGTGIGRRILVGFAGGNDEPSQRIDHVRFDAFAQYQRLSQVFQRFFLFAALERADAFSRRGESLRDAYSQEYCRRGCDGKFN